jgi:hypothetical protein
MKEISVPREWVERLLDISDDMNRSRGSSDAPSVYSLQYLFGYIDSGRSLIEKP